MSTPTAAVNHAFMDLGARQGLDDLLYGGAKCAVTLGRLIRTTSAMSFVAVPIKKEAQGESASYKLSRSADAVLHSWLYTTTPEIRVKADKVKTHRIAFTPNLFHNMVKNVTLKFNELSAVQADTVALDQISQHMEKDGKWEAYSRFIGNVPSLVGFSSRLPSKEIKLPLNVMPWEAHVSNALLLCCLKLNEVRIDVDYELDLTRLIRVQTKKADGTDDDWVDAKVSTINFSEIIEVGSRSNHGLTLALPDLMAEYGVVSAAERKFHRQEAKDYLIQQVQKFAYTRSKAGQARFDFRFNFAVRCLYFNMQNETAKEFNCHSNYTTNPTSAENGSDPLQTVSLYYDNMPRFDKFPASFFSDMVPYFHHNRVPLEVGYHAFSYSLTNGLEQDGSTNYSGLTTSLEYVAKDGDAEDERSGCYYTFQLRATSHHVARIQNDVFGFPSYGASTKKD